MPLYSVDDFQPPESKRLKRAGIVQKVAEIRVKTYNLIASRDYGLTDPIRLKETGVAIFVDAYFHNVALFKVRNKYEKTQLINQSKSCALLLKTCTALKWTSLFSYGEQALSDDFMEKLHNEFAFTLISAFAGVVSTAGTGDLERDFQICMHQGGFMSDEWACWMMTAFVKAYGSVLSYDE